VNEEQRKAIIQIASGQAKGDGPFALFAGTFSRFFQLLLYSLGKNLCATSKERLDRLG
jgi:hypothetical protein